MQTSYDAIVIGAGPAGSSAAILLARAGWSVALLEAESFPRRKVCGGCIAAGNLPLLEALGVGEAVRQRAGSELRRVALWYGETSHTAALPARRDGRHPRWGCAVAREHLDSLLLERARVSGAAVLQPYRALAVRPAEHGAAHLAAVDADRSTVTLSAPVIIRAHGSWRSPPADGRPWCREHQGSDLLAFKASFRNAALEEGLLSVLGFAGGYGGMVLGSEGLTTLGCCIRRDALAACRRERRAVAATAGETVEAFLRHQCRAVRNALDGASRVGPWLAAGPLRPGVRLEDHGGSFVIGNAAGEVHPIIGEGISMALQSSSILCEELLGCPDAFRGDMRGEMRRQQVQRRYADRWRTHFLRRMRLAACFAHAAMRPAMAAPLQPLLRAFPALLCLAALVSDKARSAVALPSAVPQGDRQEAPS